MCDNWNVEFTDEFEKWWHGLDQAEQESVAAAVHLLEILGTKLGHPYSSQIIGSRHSHMRELRVQHQGHPIRVLYAFDPRRTAILLQAGAKSGNKRWYAENVLMADRLYDMHLAQLKKEG